MLLFGSSSFCGLGGFSGAGAPLDAAVGIVRSADCGACSMALICPFSAFISCSNCRSLSFSCWTSDFWGIWTGVLVQMGKTTTIIPVAQANRIQPHKRGRVIVSPSITSKIPNGSLRENCQFCQEEHLFYSASI